MVKDVMSDNINLGQGYRQLKYPCIAGGCVTGQTPFIPVWQHLVNLFLTDTSATLPVRIHLAQVLTNCVQRHARVHTHVGVYCSHVCHREKLGVRGN